MKKLFILPLLFVLVSGVFMTSCVKAKPGCKKAHKRIKNMRKNNPHFTM